MTAWITQQNPVNECQGHAWGLLYPGAGSLPHELEDQLSRCYHGADATHYLARSGSGRWGQSPQFIKIHGKLATDGTELQLLVPPACVNVLVAGFHADCPPDTFGKLKSLGQGSFCNMVYPLVQVGMKGMMGAGASAVGTFMRAKVDISDSDMPDAVDDACELCSLQKLAWNTLSMIGDDDDDEDEDD